MARNNYSKITPRQQVYFNIAEAIQGGMDVEEVCEKFEVKPKDVKYACDKYEVDVSIAIKSRQISKTREECAKFVKETGDLEAAAREFGKSLSWVRLVCKERNIPYMKKDPGTSSSYQIIAGLIAGKKQADLAREFDVSRQFVSQINKRCHEAGIFDAVKLRGRS